MTNLALVISALAIAGLVAADATLNGWSATIFLARRGLDLIAWIAVWR